MSAIDIAQVTLCILGCGTMGKAILSGLFDVADAAASVPKAVFACVSREDSAKSLRQLYGDKVEVTVGGNVDAVRRSDVVFLCVKPQLAKTVLAEAGMREAIEEKLVVSICAGVRIAQMQEWLPKAKIIRAMPNTPCKIREGMTTLSCNADVDQGLRTFAQDIFSRLGRCRFIEEKHIDAVTGLSGSGPAFACVVLEALADGGVMMGLPRDIAVELAAQALYGAAKMVLTTGVHPAAIKDSVTTPGGCTIAGLLTMEDGKIRSTLARTIQEATRVASTLGGNSAHVLSK